MKPTFLKVGVPKAVTRAPATVKPPTEAGSPASKLSNIRCFSREDENRSTSHSWLIPSGTVSGDGILVFINALNTTSVTPPSGYTELETQSNGANIHKVYWKISDGTETDTTFTTPDSTELVFVSGRIPANGSTLTTPDIAKSTSVLVGTTFDPVAVTPAAGAGTYHVISAILYQKGAPNPDDGTALSTGYEFVTHCTNVGDLIEPAIYLQQKPSTAIVTTEDPDAIEWSTSPGSRYPVTYTLAVAVTTADPTVVGYPVTASDIDTESATDGQVLTSDGAGNAAWEDVPGGVTNGDSHDHSGGDGAQIDHGGLAGLSDDDHTHYVLADGTRAFTGDQSMGSNKLTNVTDPTAAQDAATKAYVDANAGGDYYEVIVSGSSPPVAVTNEAADDWLYGVVP